MSSQNYQYYNDSVLYPYFPELFPPIVRIISSYLLKDPIDYLRDLEKFINEGYICLFDTPRGDRLNSQIYMSKYLSNMYCRLFGIKCSKHVPAKTRYNVVKCNDCNKYVYPVRNNAKFVYCDDCWSKLNLHLLPNPEYTIGKNSRFEVVFSVQERLASFKELSYKKRYKGEVLRLARLIFEKRS